MKISAKFISVIVVAGLLPAAAFGVLRDGDFERERRNATYHAQLQILKIAVPAATPGQCRVWGEVVRIFKGVTRTFKEGERVEFDVSCVRRNDLIPTGDTQWLQISRLQDARFIETYLNRHRTGSGDELQVPVWQYRLIDGPTITPLCPDTTKGLSCEAFKVPDLGVPDLVGTATPGMTAVSVELPNSMLKRLRIVAAQRTRRSQTQRITVADVVEQLVAQEIDNLEAGVR